MPIVVFNGVGNFTMDDLQLEIHPNSYVAIKRADTDTIIRKGDVLHAKKFNRFIEVRDVQFHGINYRLENAPLDSVHQISWAALLGPADIVGRALRAGELSITGGNNGNSG